MNTRHYSGEVEYPFIPGLAGEILKLSKTILDMYVVIQGSPTGSSGSVPYPITELQSASVAVNVLTLTFRSTFTDGYYWEYTFTVPDITLQGSIQSVPAVGGDVFGVLSYKTTHMSAVVYPIVGLFEVEPARIQWHTENTPRLLFQNITRCNSVEDDLTLIDILDTDDLLEDVLEFTDGYNTKVSYDGLGNLTFEAGAGLGKGPMGDLGNSDPGACPEPDLNASIAGIYTINGLLPISGNIPLSVSSGLYIERELGKIRIRKAQE